MNARDDMLSSYIDFTACKIRYCKKMRKVSGRGEWKFKQEVYEEIHEDLLNTYKAYKKTDAELEG